MYIVKESKKIVKPSTPTPPNLRQFKLGFIDELITNSSVTIVLFFSIRSNNTLKFVDGLEKSLEKILIPFYPLAGRYVEETQTIDCNDQGVEFTKAACNITLQDLLDSKVNVKLVDEFIPNILGAFIQVTDPLLTIQVTTFECGGVALGVSVSHKIVDAHTLCIFLAKWGVMARKENEVESTGSMFNSSSLFPTRGMFPPEYRIITTTSDYLLGKIVTLKLSFSDRKISNLKEKLVPSERLGIKNWSRVQFVLALILKGLIAVDRAVHKYSRDTFVCQPINLREKTASSIPKDSCGNILAMILTICGNTEATEELADLLKHSIKNTIMNFSKVRHDDEEGRRMIIDSFLQFASIPPMTHVVPVSSWCRLPFYETDFGFGKPVWASCGSLATKNTIMLMDMKEGNGIEAYVSLEVENVSCFEEALDV